MFAFNFIVAAALLMKGASTEVKEVLAPVGSVAILPCPAAPMQNPFTVQWVRINKPLSFPPTNQKSTVWKMEASGLEFRSMGVGQRVRCPHSNFPSGNFDLHIGNVKAEDGGNYACIITRGRQKIQKQATLRVIEASLSVKQTVEGSDVKLTCSVMPWLRQAAISWTLNGCPFPPERVGRAPRSYRLGVNELFIKGVRPIDTGNWTCVVRHEGQEGRTSQLLTVRGIARPVAERARLYAEVDSPVWLPCIYTEGVIPQSPAWQRENATLPNSFSTSPVPSRPPTDQSALITSAQEQDGGVYKCTGIVDSRRVERRLQLVLARVVSTPGVRGARLALTCQLTDPTYITEYEWVLVKSDANGTQTVTPLKKGKTLTLEKMMEASGEYCCRFFGGEGILGNATWRQSVAAGALGGEKMSGTVGAGTIIGIGILLLVLLLVVLQLYKNHRRRKMILPYPALETIIHSTVNEQELHRRQNENLKA